MTLDTLFTAFQEHLPKLLAAVPVAVLVLIGGLICQLAVSRALTLLARQTRLTDTDVLPLRKVARLVVYGVTFILVLGVFGFELGGIWAMLSTILAMVAIGFVAVWSILSNTTATLLLLVLRPFQIGDTIELQSENMKGRVVDLNFFFTTLEAEDGATFQVPNNLFFQKVVKRTAHAQSIPLAEQLNRPAPAALKAAGAPS
ncbi:MAG: mechanosensitive ion channel domain-containing protein [Cephaloticoccus sp.]